MRLAPPIMLPKGPQGNLEPTAFLQWLTDLYAILALATYVITGKGAPASKPDLDGEAIGTLYLRQDGTPGATLYVKEAAGAIGWAAK